MNISQMVLKEAVKKGILQPEQEIALWSYLEQQQLENGSAHFKASHILYYLGGVIAIAAMTIFMTISHELFGPSGLTLTAFLYLSIGVFFSERYRKKNNRILMGIFATFSITQVPLLVFGVFFAMSENYHDYFTEIDSQWLILEISTLIASSLAIYRYRMSFLMLPVAVTAWFMSMDLASAVLKSQYISWDMRCWIAATYGLISIIIAFFVDLKNKKEQDFSFWLYLVGLASLSGGSLFIGSSYSGHSGATALLALLTVLTLHLTLIIVGAALSRRQFVVFGALGLFISFGYLAFDVFESSVWLPFVLCVFGFLFVRAGIFLQKNESVLLSYFQRNLPNELLDLIERRK